MNEFAHKKVAELALNYISKYSQEAIYYSDTDTKEIINAAALPDKDENQNDFAHHFYNPVTKLNFSGGNDHAINRVLLHIAKSKARVRGRCDNFAEKISCDPCEIGRALHFLTDIATPVHTGCEDAYFDTWYRAADCIIFEKITDKIAEFYEIDNYFDLPEVGDSGISSICYSTALFSNQMYFEYIRREKSVEYIAKRSLSLAILSCINLLQEAPFYSVSENKYCYILNNDDYYFENIAIKNEKYRVINTDIGLYIYEKPMEFMNYRFKEILQK